MPGISSATAHGCKLGTYTAYYPTKLKPTTCYQTDLKGGEALGYVLNAAAKHSVKVAGFCLAGFCLVEQFEHPLLFGVFPKYRSILRL